MIQASVSTPVDFVLSAAPRTCGHGRAAGARPLIATLAGWSNHLAVVQESAFRGQVGVNVIAHRVPPPSIAISSAVRPFGQRVQRGRV